MTLLVMRVLLFAVEALAVSLLLPGLAFLVTPFFRGRAALRHLFWLGVFAVLLALPLLAFLVPAHVMRLGPGPSVPVVVAMAAPVTASYADTWSTDSIIAALFAPLCGLWLLGMLFHLSRLALGAYGLRRLRTRSTAFAGGDVFLTDGGPLTFGWRRPVILLPRAAAHWPRARLDAVLRHERAHIRRHDSVTQLLAELACAFYWPNPLVWLGARRLRREAEIAADDAVLASGLQASAYAAELVQVAAEFAGRPRLLAMAMANTSTLEARVTSVLSPMPSRKGVSRKDALKLAALGSACAFALALARPDLALAEVAPQPLPPPVALSDLPSPPVPPAPPQAVPAPPMLPEAVPGFDREAIAERARERAQARAEQTREYALARAERAREQAQAQARAERVRAQGEAARERAREASERALDAARRDEMVARAGGTDESVRQSVHGITGAVMAQVRQQVAAALVQARINQEMAMADAQRKVDAAMARMHTRDEE